MLKKPCNRILLIAPSYHIDGVEDLHVLPEIDALYELGYNVQTVQDQVTRERLFQIVRHRQFEIIHFAGHSGPDGWLLDDGIILEGAAVVQLARAARANLVFTNGCTSVEIGQLLVDEHIPAAICLLGRIADDMAKETAQVFYQKLAELQDVRAAYNASKPPVKGGYSLFTNGSTGPASELLAPIMNRLDQVSESVKRLEMSTATVDALQALAKTVDVVKAEGLTVRMFKRWATRVLIATVTVLLLWSTVLLLLVRGS